MIVEHDPQNPPRIIRMRRPDNFHNHFRQKDDPRFRPTVGYIARQFARANAMGNTLPPVTTAAAMAAYRADIREAARAEGFPDFEPLMVVMLTPDTVPRMLDEAFDAGAYGVKVMPAGGTYNSAHGIRDYRARPFRECLAAVRDRGKAVLFHAEVPEPNVAPYRRERLFIPELTDIRTELPDLRICVEHISDAQMVGFVCGCDGFVSATVTPHHMEVTGRDADNDVHLQCMPYPKSRHDVEMVRTAAILHERFFYGSDNAPHLRPAKERAAPKPASGVFTAPVELPALAQLFERHGQLGRLEAFLSERGARWHGLPLNEGEVTLVRGPWTVPEVIRLPDGHEIVPYKHGETLNWRLAD